MAGDKFSVLAGTANTALPTFMLGGSGVMTALANDFPNLCSSLYKAFCKGDYEEAGILQRRISYLNKVLVKRQNQISAMKTALNSSGLPCGYPRRPALPLEGKEREEIEMLLKTTLGPSLK